DSLDLICLQSWNQQHPVELKASGDHQRKPQLDMMERSMDHGEPRPNSYVSTQLLHLWLSGLEGSRGGKT
ncbi:hypothetical protein LEMLEM_LOCUS20273, partial [Lemmus lemmus]